jgi:hypothetical protein
MRRTFQDLCRAAEVKDVVTRAISGHATEEMQHHYSTVASEEIRQNLAKVVSLAGFRKALDGAAVRNADADRESDDTGGVHGGVRGESVAVGGVDAA